MRRFTLCAMLFLVGLLMAVGCRSKGGDDSIVGTWKLDGGEVTVTFHADGTAISSKTGKMKKDVKACKAAGIDIAWRPTKWTKDGDGYSVVEFILNVERKDDVLTECNWKEASKLKFTVDGDTMKLTNNVT